MATNCFSFEALDDFTTSTALKRAEKRIGKRKTLETETRDRVEGEQTKIVSLTISVFHLGEQWATQKKKKRYGAVSRDPDCLDWGFWTEIDSPVGEMFHIETK